MRLSVFVKGLWYQMCSDQIAETLRSHIANWDFLPAEARSPCVQINKTESFYICVQRNILLIVEHKPYLHIYLHVAVTQITQTESQQHFINRTD